MTVLANAGATVDLERARPRRRRGHPAARVSELLAAHRIRLEELVVERG